MFLSYNPNATNERNRGRRRGRCRGLRRGRGRRDRSQSSTTHSSTSNTSTANTSATNSSNTNSSTTNTSTQTSSSTTNTNHTPKIREHQTKEVIDQDAVLFQIWFLVNGWNKTLIYKFEENSIKTLKDLQNISLYDLFQFISSIDWTQYDANTQKNVLDKIEEIRKQPVNSNESTSMPICMPHHSSLSSGAGMYGSHSHVNAPVRPVRRSRGGRGRRRGARGRGCAPTRPMRSPLSTTTRPMRSPLSTRSRGKGRGRAISSRSPAMTSAPKIGFAVGGANDINSFRDNIMSNMTPQLNAITFEGIYYDYYFNTQSNETGTDVVDDINDELPLFYPSYCYAKSFIPDAILMAHSKYVTKRSNIKTDMIEDDNDVANIYDVYDFGINKSTKHDNNSEYFLTVGLNSNLKEEDFERHNLNLVVVLDISGSMSLPFEQTTNIWGRGSKMKTANECILSLITNLKRNDRFGLVLFDHTTSVAMNFKKIKDHNFKSFQQILNITARGATDFELGYKEGLKMFNNKLESKDDEMYENRIIFLTDACPNSGVTEPDSLMNMVKKAALNTNMKKRIYTTFVGVGLDFNADLISEISKVRGANYFAVHCSGDFMKKLHLEFDYIVSPMVFDLKLLLQNEGAYDNSCIEAVYGSNDIDMKSGEILSINTLFPSPPNDDGEIKGGIVLIQLKKCMKEKMDNVIIECTFEDKYGVKHKNKQHVVFKKDRINEEFYANMGIRKGILLTRYVILMKHWIENTGVKYKNEKLKVNGKYKQIFKHFMRYFKSEMSLLKDKELEQEIKLLEKLMKV